MSPSAVVCTSPADLAAGYAIVEVTNNALDFSNSGHHVDMVELPLLNVQPYHGPLDGGTNVTIAARGLPPGNYRCAFGNLAYVTRPYATEPYVTTPATWQSASLLACASPASNLAGVAILRVQLDNVTLRSALRFHYRASPRLLSIQPASGPVDGGTTLTLLGEQLYQTVQLFCKFGEVDDGVGGAALAIGTTSTVLARWVHDGRVECDTPSNSNSTGYTAVELTINDQQYTDDGLVFYYTPAIELEESLPLTGPTSGGTHVNITGTGFLSPEITRRLELECRFNETRVPVVASGATWVVCYAPPHPIGQVDLQVTNNGQSFTSDTLVFEYVGAVLLGVSPSAGPVSGGTVVHITGVDMPIGQVVCRFGAEGVDAYLETTSTTDVSTSAVCVTPRVASAATLQISIHALGTAHGNELSFVYFDDPELTELRPAVGPQYGGTRVRVTGRNFRDTGRLFCVFGVAAFVRAQWVTPAVIDCVTPTSVRTGTVGFRVSLNGQQYLNVSNAGFTYQALPELTTITPSKSPVDGGSNVTVSGHYFSPISQALGLMRCRFGTSLVLATRTSSTSLTCIVPPGVNGYTSVQITDNGYDFSNGLAFDYTPTGVLYVSPATGPVDGGTLIQVSGSSVTPTPLGIECLFANNVTTPATFVSSAQLECDTPPVSSAYAASVRLLRADTVLEGGATFVYSVNGIATELLPSSGPQLGGTVVTIVGEYFEQLWARLFCRFGESLVPAHHLSRSRLQCIAPPLTAARCPLSCRTVRNGQHYPDSRASYCPASCNNSVPSTVQVYVTSNGEDFVTSNQSYSYDSDVVVRGLWPRYGPEQGGTVVTITGEGFRSDRHLRCRFGTVALNVTLIDSARLQCVTPPAVRGYVSVELSSNGGVDFTQDGHQFWFAASVVHSVQPSSGPELGGTIVRVRGSQLVAQNLTCLFDGVRVVNATFESTNVASCVAPVHDAPYSTAPTLVQLVNGNATIGGNAWFHQLAPPVIHGIFPVAGPLSGGTVVTVSGSAFRDELDATCRFTVDGQSYTSAARWLSALRLQCYVPSVPLASFSAVEVSMNGQDFSSSASSNVFEFYDPVLVLRASPLLGPLNGGTNVTFVGSNFDRASTGRLQCRFNSTVVAAELISTTEISCSAPSSSVAGLVAVEVSHNLLDFTGDGGAARLNRTVLCSPPPLGSRGSARATFASLHAAHPRTEAHPRDFTCAVLFEYVDSSISSLDPAFGPVDGATVVIVRGDNLGLLPSLHCTFGTALSVQASIASQNAVHCRAPAAAGAGQVGLRLHVQDRKSVV